MESQGIHFPVIYIYRKHGCPTSPNWRCLSWMDYTKALYSSHGALITYVDDNFTVFLIKKINSSYIWDGLFLKLKHCNMQNEIIVANLYKPPRDNNNTANIKAFREEL